MHQKHQLSLILVK